MRENLSSQYQRNNVNEQESLKKRPQHNNYFDMMKSALTDSSATEQNHKEHKNTRTTVENEFQEQITTKN